MRRGRWDPRRRLFVLVAHCLDRHVWLRAVQDDVAATAEQKSSRTGRRGIPANARRFCGTWEVESTAGYDAYLQKLGLSWAKRKAAAALRPMPTYTIRDSVLHGSTPGVLGTPMQDVFSTGHTKRSSMGGYAVDVQYSWRPNGTLVARVRSVDSKLAEGKAFEVWRWVDQRSGRLVATSSVDGCEYVRWYRRVRGRGTSCG